MVDVTEISAIVVAAGVLVGVVYYGLEIRQQTKARQDMAKTTQADLVMRLYSTWGSDDMRKAVQGSTALEDEYKDYDNFVKKYGFTSQAWVDINKILWFWNGIGFLVHEGFVNIKLALGLFYAQGVIRTWEKWKPFVEGQRKAFGLPESYAQFEYLYDEVKKREQQLASKTA
jgi:hypothetical protein